MNKLAIITGLLLAAGQGWADSSWPLSQAMELQYDTPVNRLQILGAHNAWNDSDATWANLATLDGELGEGAGVALPLRV